MNAESTLFRKSFHIILDERVEALLLAVRSGNLMAVERLLTASDVDVNERHQFGWTALHIAAYHGDVDMIEMLLRYGADVNACDEFSDINHVAAKTRTNMLEGSLVSIVRLIEEEMNSVCVRERYCRCRS